MTSIKLFQDAGGDLIEVVRITDGRVHFHAQGGGFEFSTPQATFDSDFTPATLTWKQVWVTGDWCDPGESYPAWWDGRRWNGWIVPYFEPTTVAAMSTSAAFSNLYQFGLTWAAAQGDDGVETFLLEYIELQPGTATTLYGIGARSWCWELAEELAEEQQ